MAIYLYRDGNPSTESEATIADTEERTTSNINILNTLLKSPRFENNDLYIDFKNRRYFVEENEVLIYDWFSKRNFAEMEKESILHNRF